MKTILFGGSGFLGYHMLKNNPDIISVGRSCIDKSLANKHIFIKSIENLAILDNLDFDNVIFLVGNSNHHILNDNNLLAMEYNVLPLKNVLNYLKNRKINKFIHYTSILLYGNKCKDSLCSETSEIFPYENEYIFSKYLAENIANFYKEKVPIITARLTNIYGPTKLRRPDIINKLVYDTLEIENPTVWSFLPKRDFIHVNDATNLTKLLLTSNFTGTINLCSGNSISIEKISKILENLSGKKIKSLEKKVTGPMNFSANTDLLYSVTGYKSEINIEDGLFDTYFTTKTYL